MEKRIICVAGLPRSGSTLLCQLLAQHPELYCDGHSSPLCNSLLATRRYISDDQFFLSQLDSQFEDTYSHLHTAMQGFLNGWYQNVPEKNVVDKNRAWLHCIELLLKLDPDAKMLVPIRELGQVYGSIETQHQKTILMDFVDHLADYDRMGRADQLFAVDKAIGSPLSSISAVQDLPQEVKDRIYFIKFEDLMESPIDVMNKIFKWLDIQPCKIDEKNILVRPNESDSHYRYKYLHKQSDCIRQPAHHDIPARIQKQIETACAWFYAWFYPSIK